MKEQPSTVNQWRCDFFSSLLPLVRLSIKLNKRVGCFEEIWVPFLYRYALWVNVTDSATAQHVTLFSSQQLTANQNFTLFFFYLGIKGMFFFQHI